MNQGLRRIAAAAVAAAAFSLPAGARAQSVPAQQQQAEMAIGQQEYQQLAMRGEILQQSPYYAALEPVAEKIAAVADPQYFAPFHFILVNERSPNAFSVPGGNVYVTASMMRFAHNQDELAAVLCHEVSHDIHHDAYNNQRKAQHLSMIAGALGSVLGAYGGYGGYFGQMAVGAGAGVAALGYSRADESNADHAGAYLCAQAGFNPWGMVWLFERLESEPSKAKPEWLSDHPSDGSRVSALEATFKNDPATFGRFADDPSAAKPLQLPTPDPWSPQHGNQQGYPQPGQPG